MNAKKLKKLLEKIAPGRTLWPVLQVAADYGVCERTVRTWLGIAGETITTHTIGIRLYVDTESFADWYVANKCRKKG